MSAEFMRILYVRQAEDPAWGLERVLDLARRIEAHVTVAGCVGRVSPDLLGLGKLDEHALEEVEAEGGRERLEIAKALCTGPVHNGDRPDRPTEQESGTRRDPAMTKPHPLAPWVGTSRAC